MCPFYAERDTTIEIGKSYHTNIISDLNEMKKSGE